MSNSEWKCPVCGFITSGDNWEEIKNKHVKQHVEKTKKYIEENTGTGPTLKGDTDYANPQVGLNPDEEHITGVGSTIGNDEAASEDEGTEDKSG